MDVYLTEQQSLSLLVGLFFLASCYVMPVVAITTLLYAIVRLFKKRKLDLTIGILMLACIVSIGIAILAFNSGVLNRRY